MLANVKADFFLADRAYDAQERVVDKLKKKNCEAVIPSKSNRVEPRDYDRHLYKARHLIENYMRTSPLFATLDSLLNGGNLRNATVSQTETVPSARNPL